MKAIKRDDLILLVYKLRLLIYPFTVGLWCVNNLEKLAQG